ncbi:hypothetical protein [Urechidicola croceus]|uniref:Uncharacterized protein n=1 Tax=Urechidicola croceus TaxID=1850246 RepID=A0A1D8P4U5_9FLAO|nr:hypothetical protein [Urechidicola croceus]AOW19577.1 hypothetical protein LPB138_02290 [Urechidicola croceus]
MRNSIKITAIAFALTVIGCNTKTETITATDVVETPEVVELAAITAPKSIEQKRSVVFIAGYDKGGNTYYKDAKAYFESQNKEVVETAYSLQEIILWLNINHNNNPYSEIHIVNKSKLNEMSIETTVKGEKVTSETLKNVLADGSLPKLKNVLTKDAKLIFHASGIGNDIDLMDTFKEAFKTDIEPSIVSTSLVSVFGGKFTPHYLAKPYYGYYPTANSPGRIDLAKEFSKKYDDSDIDWFSVLDNESEKYQGDIYTYKFNVPVKWEFDYENEEEIPSFRTLEEMYDWMKENQEIAKDLEQMNIPIQKFRWFETVKGNKLIIKGKSTVVVVLEPVMSPAYPQEYMTPTIDNLRLFDTL